MLFRYWMALLEDVTVREGESATFNCTVSGSSDTPSWIIDGVTYTSSQLPPRHSYLRPQLRVSNVNISDNGTTYQCLVIPVLSDIATLTVVLLEGQYDGCSTYKLPSATQNYATTTSVESSDITMQIRLHHILNCANWTNTDQIAKLQDMETELAVFIGQRCCCESPSTLITRAHFTCPSSHPPPPHPQHVTYRASIATTGQLNRTMLEAVLREWPVIHRAILLQGELLSVDDTCPVIISSFEEEECLVVISSNLPRVSLEAFLAAISVALVTSMALVMMSFCLCKKWVI